MRQRPEQIASELVNLDVENVEKFLRTYGYRFAFCARAKPSGSKQAKLSYVVVSAEALAAAPPGPIKPDAIDRRRHDPETGAPISGTTREPKRWKAATSEKPLPREAYHWLRSVRQGRENIERRNEASTLLNWATLLRGMWTHRESEVACQAIGQIFAPDRIRTGGLPERSAIQVTASDGLTFKSRDLLDTMAWTILEAARRGWLRRCKQSCSRPLFVAYQPGQDYCYNCGGIHARRRSKLKWASKHRAAARNIPSS